MIEVAHACNVAYPAPLHEQKTPIMKKSLPTPTGSFQLEESLEKLHRESTEWLSEIDFWKDEAAFFYSLMIRRKPATAVSKTKLAKDVEKELIRLSADHMVELHREVTDHEAELSRIIESKILDEQPYRQVHEDLRARIQETEADFRALKKQVFNLVKTSPVKSKLKTQRKDAILL